MGIIKSREIHIIQTFILEGVGIISRIAHVWDVMVGGWHINPYFSLLLCTPRHESGERPNSKESLYHIQLAIRQCQR